jgi:hypothetical protein
VLATSFSSGADPTVVEIVEEAPLPFLESTCQDSVQLFQGPHAEQVLSFVDERNSPDSQRSMARIVRASATIARVPFGAGDGPVTIREDVETMYFGCMPRIHSTLSSPAS